MKGVIAPGWWELMCGASEIGEGGVRHAPGPRRHREDPPRCRVTVFAHEQFATANNDAADAKAGIGQKGDRNAVYPKSDRGRL